MIHLTRIACAVILVLGCIMMEARKAAGQMVWNPPCDHFTIHNATAFTVQLSLVTSGGTINSGLLAAEAVSSPFPTVPPEWIILGVVSGGGNYYPVEPAPEPPPGPMSPNANHWIHCVQLSTDDMHVIPPCVDIWFDTSLCIVYVAPATCLPGHPCRP